LRPSLAQILRREPLGEFARPIRKLTEGKPMKYVIAVIKPFKFDDVRKALTGIGIEGMTVTEVKGFGRQKGQTEIYRGNEYEVSLVPKIKIEVACSDQQAPQIVEAIESTAKTGKIGDGKIFITDLGEALRIRTGEKGAEAL
jgi:nitrogen regulatory protein P-II 2